MKLFIIIWKRRKSNGTIEATNGKEKDRRVWARAICLLHDVQKGCSFCKNFDWGEARAITENRFSHVSNATGSYRFPLEEQFNYCPVCGRLNPRKLPGEEK